jgi:ssDNA-binding Zn-finger/Zn-ribbon topoisomerase 1
MLQRKTPIQAKTGFKKRGGKLRAVSSSRRIKNADYEKAKAEYFEEKNYQCEICNQAASDLHHKKGRGKFLCDKSSFMALCRPCHTYLHNNVAWARENGYIIYDYK